MSYISSRNFPSNGYIHSTDKINRRLYYKLLLNKHNDFNRYFPTHPTLFYFQESTLDNRLKQYGFI